MPAGSAGIIYLTERKEECHSGGRQNSGSVDDTVELRVTEGQVLRAAMAELLDSFSDARVDSLALDEYRARYIAGGMLSRLRSIASVQKKSKYRNVKVDPFDAGNYLIEIGHLKDKDFVFWNLREIALRFCHGIGLNNGVAQQDGVRYAWKIAPTPMGNFIAVFSNRTRLTS